MAPAVEQSGPDLVGRSTETAALADALRAALDGRGRAVLISGDAGIGKSELAAEVSSEARAAGALSLWGAGAEDGGAPPYWVWRQVLRALVRGLDRDVSTAVLGRDAAALGALLPDLPDLPAPGPTSDPFAVQEAMSGVLTRAAAHGPLLIVLEDMHVADASTVRLAVAVARSVRDSRILLVATVRPAETAIDPALAAAMAGLGAAAESLTPGGLGASDVAELLRRAGGSEPAPGLVARVLERTDGNPLFVREIARLVAGEPTRADGEWPVPGSIRQALRRRLVDLVDLVDLDGGAGRDLLEIGAVTGRDFDLATVSAVSGRPWDELAPVLDRAVAARLIDPVADSGHRVRFAHVLVRDTVYEDLAVARRAERHAAIAAALDARLDEADPTRASVLAHHRLRAVPVVDVDLAAESCERAGQEATLAAVHDAAAGHFQDAIRVLEHRVPVDLAQRCRLLLQLGEARTKAGDPAGGRRVLAQAAALARRTGNHEGLARAALRSADRLDFNDADQPVTALLREALERLPDESSWRAPVLARLAVVRYHADRDEAIRLSEEAVVVARRLGEPRALAQALSGWIYAVWGRHDPAVVLAVADEIVDLGRAAADAETEVEGRVWRIVFRLETGAVPAAEREVHAVARLAERLRQPLHRLLATSRAATLATLRGRFTEAIARAREARDIGTRGGEPDADAVFWGQVFSIWWLEPSAVEDADIAEMEDILRRLTASSPVSHAPGLVLVCLRRGDEEEARARYAALRDAGVDAFPPDMLRVWNLCLLATACVEFGDGAFAEEIYAALLPRADRVAVAAGAVACAGAVSHYLGLLAWCAQRPEDSARHLADAVARHASMGARPLLTASTAWQARVTPTRTPFTLRRDGEFWEVALDSRTVRVRDRRGWQYLAVLVTSPSRSVPALDLITGAGPRLAPSTEDPGRHIDTGTGSDEVLDATARAAYRARIDELQAERDEARAWNDTERAVRLDAELRFLVDELAAATGLGGRRRRTVSPAERARVSVTRAIRTAIAALAAADPAMGRFLEDHVRTGGTCSFEPDDTAARSR